MNMNKRAFHQTDLEEEKSARGKKSRVSDKPNAAKEFAGGYDAKNITLAREMLEQAWEYY
ncbi:isoleucine tRS [Acrasis kona]|uniref:Isoleucine tRS n=1 Tax=Acrasis kona TaxID=1008807 RepID=A0AAW2YRV8_9EUKA